VAGDQVRGHQRHDVPPDLAESSSGRCGARRRGAAKEDIMTPLPHHYDVQLSGGPNGYATVATSGLPNLTSAPPPAFDGPGDAWTPEHLLLAAVETCFLFTFRAVAKHADIAFAKLDLSSEGIVDRQDGRTRFTEIVLRPRLTVATGTDMHRVRSALEKTERACLVSASLSTPVRVEPQYVMV
jgi:peroxiredoxin-like protein